MSYGSNIAVEDAEDEYREETARLIAMHAAELVAARDMTRDAAITAAVEHQRYCQEAELDPTGTVATLDEAQRPQPSRSVSEKQIRAIADELMEQARDAVDVNNRGQTTVYWW